MSVSTIDGTLEAATMKRKASKVWRLTDLTFRAADGTETVLKSAVATPEVGAALQPGTTGRFYLYNAVDHKGIHGVRPTGGALVTGFMRVNERLMALLFAINLVWVGVMIGMREGVPLLGVGLIVFSGVLFFVYRATRVEAEAQVAADNPPI
ncbi:hypothetical protein sos41_05670 [Alphaproteobacteria bacterium SO-S41]|nr:hypothetical protein sos41_05670 [Alphaproteobacteria bacterium SO-S41]